MKANKPISVTVTLNEGEQATAIQLGALRTKSNRDAGVTNSKVGKKSDEDMDRDGIAGEIAFCKIVNSYPDMSIEPRKSVDDLGDLVYMGFNIDVKTTELEDGRLLATKWKKGYSEIYVLMTGVFPTFTYRGCMSKEKLIDKRRLGDLGRGPTYIAMQGELHTVTHYANIRDGKK